MIRDNNLDGLPNGWVWTKLDDLAEKINPGFPSGKHNKESRGFPHIRPMNISVKGEIDLSNVKYVEASDFEPLLNGDVLFNNTNSPEMLGKTTYLKQDTDWAYSNHMTRIRIFRQFIEPAWVAYYLHHLFYNGFFKMNCVHHVNQASINTGFLSQKVSIPLAPLPEQHRILAHIDELFSRLDAGVEALQNAKAQLKRYRQAVLKAAVEGRLTKEWREAHPDVEPAEKQLERIMKEHRKAWENELHAYGKNPHQYNYRPPEEIESSDLPKLPNNWIWATTDQLASTEKYSMAIGPFGSNLKVVDYRTRGVPLIFVRNIRSGKFDGPDTWFVSKEKAEELKAHFVKGGDILITKMGDPPGDACIYPEGMPPAIITADCIKWQLSSLHQERSYFLNAVNSILVKKQILKVTKGVAQQKISLDRFKKIGIPVPPQAEQVQIAKSIYELFSIANETEMVLTQSTMLSVSLRQSILKRAFEGKLVPQDPNDEPASVLLERIRAEGARKTPGLKNRSKSRKTKDVKQSMLS